MLSAETQDGDQDEKTGLAQRGRGVPLMTSSCDFADSGPECSASAGVVDEQSAAHVTTLATRRRRSRRSVDYVNVCRTTGEHVADHCMVRISERSAVRWT